MALGVMGRPGVHFGIFLLPVGSDTTSYHARHPEDHKTLQEVISLCSVQKALTNSHRLPQLLSVCRGIFTLVI